MYAAVKAVRAQPVNQSEELSGLQCGAVWFACGAAAWLLFYAVAAAIVSLF